MTRILVLGTSGMLGSMAFNYFSENPDLDVYGTVREQQYQLDKILIFDAYSVSDLETPRFKNLALDFIINCIGITKPFSHDSDPEGVKRAIRINSNFPWQLGAIAQNMNIKVIQIATDCVFSGKKGLYKEDDVHDPLDVYGKTKSLGEVFDGSVLNIRTSIIGPEPKDQKSYLLEWFLSQPNGENLNGLNIIYGMGLQLFNLPNYVKN